MNKKFTPRIIAIIVMQCIVIMITVTAIGGAVIAHNRFKATAYSGSSASDSQGKDSDGKADSEKEKKEIVRTDYEYSYAGFTPNEIDAKTDVTKMLLNQNNILPDKYKPVLAELVKDSDVKLDYRVAPFFKAMYDAALENGITLTPVTGYRSYSKQKELFDELTATYTNDGIESGKAAKKAVKSVMIPGGSEHNAGIAIDICSISRSFEDTNEFEWLNENAANYGFILRYPKGKSKITGSDYKPWHYRFVGIEAAKTIKSQGITLEEYLKTTK